jgi:single-strand DNA-binding protein
MADVNHVTLIGRLTRDAELKYTTTGFPISNFSLALNRRRKNGDQWIDEANFFDVSLFGKSAEGLKAYLLKGKQVAVEGELRQDRWEQDGQPRSKVIISATNVQLLGSGQGAPSGGGSYAGGSTASGNYGNSAGGTGAPGQAATHSLYQSREGYEPLPDTGEEFAEDIPF